MIKKLSSKIVYENKWMKVREDDVEFSDRTRGIYGVVEKPDAALIIPKLKDTYVLVKPYRYTIGAAHWEFPNGGVEGEVLTAKLLAKRELQEETGYIAGTMQPLNTLHIAYGYSNQLIHIFLAENLTEGEPNRESGEKEMLMDEFTSEQIDTMILSGEITDSNSIAAWAIFKMKSV